MGEGIVDNGLKMMDGCSREWMWPSGSPRGGGSCSRFLLVKGQFFLSLLLVGGQVLETCT